MTLGERIQIILDEKNMKQREFATAIGVTPNYINLLINGKKLVISTSLALLIEQLYGYSSKWILTGEGEKRVHPDDSLLLAEVIAKVKTMSDAEVFATLAFVNSLDELYRKTANKE